MMITSILDELGQRRVQSRARAVSRGKVESARQDLVDVARELSL